MSSVVPGSSAGRNPQLQAKGFAYLQRVRSGEVPPCEPDTAAWLAGIVRGMATGTYRKVSGMTPRAGSRRIPPLGRRPGGAVGLDGGGRRRG